jgi:CheY-like chemotaxis protein
MPVILLADDSDDDVFLIRRTLQTANILNPLRVVHDGEQVLAYFKGEPPYDDREAFPLPELLLLDLKMPRLDGFEVLAWLRQQPAWRKLPVAVLTSSTDVRDANAAFGLGANSFLIKPIDFMRFAEFAQAMAGSWLWVSQVPCNKANLCSQEPLLAAAASNT